MNISGEDAGWVGGLSFRPRRIGRVKLGPQAHYYRNRWVELVGDDPKHADGIVVWIHPTERYIPRAWVIETRMFDQPKEQKDP